MLSFCNFVYVKRERGRVRKREMFHNLYIRFTSVKMINSDEVTADIAKYMYE